jgi:hypothetical protein
MLWLLKLACTSSLPQGVFLLEGDKVIGEIRVIGGGCSQRKEIAFWGPHWGTNGFVPFTISFEDDIKWISFPLETGLGTGHANLRLQGEEAYFLLGSKQNEFYKRMTLIPEKEIGDAGVLEAQNRWDEQKIQDEEHWSEGAFVILDNDKVVGEIQLIPEEPAEVLVYDSFWLTPSLVEAIRFDEGTDISLIFPIEPSIEGEDAFLRMNTLLWEIRVPISDVSSELDRQLQFRAGRISDEARNTAIEAAIADADKMEESLVIRDGKELLKRATHPSGCHSFEDIVNEEDLLWLGYDVEIHSEEERCLVAIEGNPKQHRRRFSGRINQNGITEQ